MTRGWVQLLYIGWGNIVKIGWGNFVKRGWGQLLYIGWGNIVKGGWGNFVKRGWEDANTAPNLFAQSYLILCTNLRKCPNQMNCTVRPFSGLLNLFTPKQKLFQ